MRKRSGVEKPTSEVEISVSAISALAKPALLRTEDLGEFETLHRALRKEIRPKGIIEEICVYDVTHLTWEIWRLRRAKAAIINYGYHHALREVLPWLSGRIRAAPELIASNELTDKDAEIVSLARKWFHSVEAKESVAQILDALAFDESLLEAKAIQFVLDDLSRFENMLTSVETRRERLLRQIEANRQDFVNRVRAATDRIIDAECDDASALNPRSQVQRPKQ